MNPRRSVRRVAIVGAGTIGASWATHYLARGLEVIATDPAPGAREALDAYVESAWEGATALARRVDASRSHLTFTADLREAVAAADFVQENAPERLDIKAELFAEIDRAAACDVIVASSSSGLLMTEIQQWCAHPERMVIGHPMNPPHLMPLVEVVAGSSTSRDTVQAAVSFYRSVGKRPIHLHKEIAGHAVNRLQSALYRELVYLIDAGVIDPADADDVVSWGPGLRWGVMGPNLLWHLGGGQGGIQAFAEHLMDPLASSWRELGDPQLTDALKQTIIEAVLKETAGQSIDELAARRDAMLVRLQAIRTEDALLGP